ncbi:pyrophosphatase PpaX [Virgibacillus halodenitrificans]|uniref:Pyrophosphatase PpaX n=1 Tax=Virgibacillus halodenitrificans TaxID=1482 RepID=A0AAC9J1T7_VIRHA|nr:pyrophosphatase PpaX [Virgibacillus halodenitrificans]APC49114.1 pyrophosphatase PpaX [Virgibacillus halodenitrificans]MCG1026872.1 pyrophosphatase PpaX [Virgibacillus halodenitrificans]MYL44646.1 pyrophosphatase PpaX [Virgibacillus halodenitrificans]CDQ30808.1 Pyrophosphatase PpaX [Virgibacillus halodenitrificans]
MNIDTILFDLDGTLIDTNELITASFEHTFKKHNLSFTKEEIMGFNGPPLLDTFHNIDPERADVLVKTYREHNLAEHDRYVKAFPYAVETIQKLKNSGKKVGIVSTKMAKSVHMGLTLTGLEPLFNTIITYDDVQHAKPHPEPVIKAMKELDADGASTLMVGDNYHDIVAGKNAGVQTAGVSWAHKGRDSLLAYKPTYMLEDMRDLLKITGV